MGPSLLLLFSHFLTMDSPNDSLLLVGPLSVCAFPQKQSHSLSYYFYEHDSKISISSMSSVLSTNPVLPLCCVFCIRLKITTNQTSPFPFQPGFLSRILFLMVVSFFFYGIMLYFSSLLPPWACIVLISCFPWPSPLAAFASSFPFTDITLIWDIVSGLF